MVITAILFAAVPPLQTKRHFLKQMMNLQVQQNQVKKNYNFFFVQFNSYEVDHPSLKGQLKLLSIPTNILEVPRDSLTRSSTSDLPAFVIGTQAIVSFTSQKEKSVLRVPIKSDIDSAKKVDVTSFIIDPPYEPWNEFILEGSPPMMVRTKTVLTKLQWIEGYTDQVGGPSLWAQHNTTHSVSSSQTGEAGMT
jgi:hypothetical protein